MRNLNSIVLSGDDTGSVIGGAVDSNQMVSASFQIVFGDATAVGTFKLQASNDIYNDRYNFPLGTFMPTNWTDIPLQTVAVTAGASQLLTIPNMTYRWIRAVYTRASGGSTTVNVTINALEA